MHARTHMNARTHTNARTHARAHTQAIIHASDLYAKILSIVTPVSGGLDRADAWSLARTESSAARLAAW